MNQQQTSNATPTITLVRPAVLNDVTDTQLAELERQFDEGDRQGFITRARSYGWTDREIQAVWQWFSSRPSVTQGQGVARGETTPGRTTSNDGARSLYERVVILVNRDDHSDLALDHAATLARALTLPIHLLHVVDISSLAPASLLGLDDVAFVTALGLIDAETALAVEYLEEVGQRLVKQGFAPTFEVRRGLGIPDLFDAVWTTDLLVMVAPTPRGLADWLLGDDLETVIRDLPATVLLVHPSEAAEAASLTERTAA
jgi:nucleotide-binding universal stress UspA family protein